MAFTKSDAEAAGWFFTHAQEAEVTDLGDGLLRTKPARFDAEKPVDNGMLHETGESEEELVERIARYEELTRTNSPVVEEEDDPTDLTPQRGLEGAEKFRREDDERPSEDERIERQLDPAEAQVQAEREAEEAAIKAEAESQREAGTADAEGEQVRAGLEARDSVGDKLAEKDDVNAETLAEAVEETKEEMPKTDEEENDEDGRSFARSRRRR